MYHYWAYGLRVSSDIRFPELLEIDANESVDAHVFMSDLRANSIESSGAKSSVHIEKNSYRMNIPEVAIYDVADGNSIVIQSYAKASEDAIRLFCLSNAFAALLQQKGLMPLHCAAVLKNGSTSLIFGHSGSGKSTTLVGLMNKGFTVISDDVVVPFIHKDRVWIHSSYPMIKLWKETVDRFGLWDRMDRQIRPDMEKYGLYFYDLFSTEPHRPLRAIFLEKSDQISCVGSRAIQGIELFERLDSNLYRGENLGYMDLKENHFLLVSKLAGQIEGFVVQRPVGLDSFEESLNTILEITAD